MLSLLIGAGCALLVVWLLALAIGWLRLRRAIRDLEGYYMVVEDHARLRGLGGGQCADESSPHIGTPPQAPPR